MEGDGKSYEIKKYGKVGRKSFVYMKLTETAERALNEFIQNKLNKRKKITIQFDGVNRIVIPKRDESCTLTFDLTDCFDLNGAQGEMSLCSQIPNLPFTFCGFFQHRLKIHAKYESFQQASEKLRIIENNQRTVKQLDTLPTGRKCALAKRKLSLPEVPVLANERNRRSVQGAPNKSSMDAIKRATNQPLNKSGETLYKRFIHLLALKPLKKMDITKKISLSEVRSFSERARYFSILKDVSYIEMDSYNLRNELWTEVALDWPHYTESERRQVESNVKEMKSKTPATQLSSLSSNRETKLSSQSLSSEADDAMPGDNSECNRPGYYRTSDGLETKRRRIARVPPRSATIFPEVKKQSAEVIEKSADVKEKTAEVKDKSVEVEEKDADQFGHPSKKKDKFGDPSENNNSGSTSSRSNKNDTAKNKNRSSILSKNNNVVSKVAENCDDVRKSTERVDKPSENSNSGSNFVRGISNETAKNASKDGDKMVLRQRSSDSIPKTGMRNLRSDFNAKINDAEETSSLRAVVSIPQNDVSKATKRAHQQNNKQTKSKVDSLVSDLDDKDCALLLERLSKRMTTKGHISPKTAICPSATEYATPPAKCPPFRLDATPENNFATGKYDFNSPKGTPKSFPDMSPIDSVGSRGREKEKRNSAGGNMVKPEMNAGTTTRRSLRSNLMLANNLSKNESAKSAEENFNVLDLIAAYCSKNQADSELLKEIGENPIVKMGNVEGNISSQRNADPKIVAARLKRILGDWKGCATKSCMDVTICQMLSMGTKRLDSIRQIQRIIDSYKPITKIRQRDAYKAEYDKENKHYGELVENVKDHFEKLKELKSDQINNDPHSDYIETVLLMVKLSHIKHLIRDYDRSKSDHI